MKIKSAALVAAAALVLAGCGGGGDSSSGSGKGSSKAAAEKAPLESEQDYPAEGGAPEEPEDMGTEVVKVGKSYNIQVGSEAENDYSELKLTIKSVTCSEPVVETDYEGEQDYKSVEPKKGYKFCIVRATGVNAGDRPIEYAPDPDGLVSTADQLFAPTSETEELYPKATADTDETGFSSPGPLNPGESAKLADVYQVPKNVTPKQLSYANTMLVTFELPKP